MTICAHELQTFDLVDEGRSILRLRDDSDDVQKVAVRTCIFRPSESKFIVLDITDTADAVLEWCDEVTVMRWVPLLNGMHGVAMNLDGEKVPWPSAPNE